MASMLTVQNIQSGNIVFISIICYVLSGLFYGVVCLVPSVSNEMAHSMYTVCRHLLTGGGGKKTPKICTNWTNHL
jgi:hypothetical protein